MRIGKKPCLNPCSNGSVSLIQVYKNECEKIYRLDPCSNGSISSIDNYATDFFEFNHNFGGCNSQIMINALS